ncbi:MAG: minimal chain-length factor beta [Acidimicrobiaceae bacterium]|nr:minimal chain-length factor beta [Acidimicrobiaceae bacterium]
MSEARAVITGLGIVAPNGIGAPTFWGNTRKGLNGIRKIDRFDVSKYATQVAGVVEGFEATDYIDKRLMVQTDNWTWMALAGAKLAMEDAAFDAASHEPDRMSVVTASSSGGNEFGQREIQSLWAKGPRFVGAYQSIAWFYAATTGQLSIKHGMKGACGVVVSEQAGGLDALALARRQIRRGEADAVLSGGTEAPVGPYAITCQEHNCLMAEGDDPDAAYRPFGTEAHGYVPGEGGAILLVEGLDQARARGAEQVYAEIIGHAATQDGNSHTAPAADGHYYGRALQLALDDAGIGPDDVDVVFADGFGTPESDAAEVAALQAVFGSRASSVPVTAPKSMVGRLYAGGSSLDVATAALAITDGYIPPTINVGSPAFDLDLVTEGRAQPMDTVLVGARGIGGFNSAMVLRRVTE